MIENSEQGQEAPRDDSMLTITKSLQIPRAELDLRFSRSGGPGGQNVNKVSTKATLLWNIQESSALTEAQRERLLHRLPGSYLTKDGVFQVSSSKERDQHRNRRDCEEKFASMLQAALKRQKKRRKTKPSRGSIERRLKAKKQRSQIKSMRRNVDH